jgi:hypothetical protein
VTVPGPDPPPYPGYDVLSQRRNWDSETAGVVLARLGPMPALRFFTAHEEPTARALVDILLEQNEEPRVPVLEMIDARLLERAFDGYRYVDMPDDDDAWRRSIAGIDADASERFGVRFHELTAEDQMRLIVAVRVDTGVRWGMPAKRVFEVWLRYACTAFYSHPWAWNEIGFGGPAYPRGYKALGVGKREPWERDEAEDLDPVKWGERVERARQRSLQEPERRQDRAREVARGRAES